jgi:hypothetical protein
MSSLDLGQRREFVLSPVSDRDSCSPIRKGQLYMLWTEHVRKRANCSVLLLSTFLLRIEHERTEDRIRIGGTRTGKHCNLYYYTPTMFRANSSRMDIPRA